MKLEKPGCCNSCGCHANLHLIHKQIAGEFITMYVCDECLEEHKKYLESLRQNFRAQFGEK